MHADMLAWKGLNYDVTNYCYFVLTELVKVS